MFVFLRGGSTTTTKLIAPLWQRTIRDTDVSKSLIAVSDEGRTNVAENRQTVGKYKRKNRQCLYDLTACRTYSVCYILMCLRYI